MEQIPKPIIDFPKLKDWLKITPEKKVIFFSGRVELGQGNKTALEMMIADELDDLPEAINLQMARTDCTPNEGFTAGSMSIVHGGQALRWVAASFRRKVIEASSLRLNAELDKLKLVQGQIFNENRLCFPVSKVLDDIDLNASIVDGTVLKKISKRWRSSKNIEWIDLVERMSGTPFIHDIEEPNMLYGSPIHPANMYSKIVDFDKDALLSRPGIVKIVKDGSFVGVLANSQHEALAAAEWGRSKIKWNLPEKGSEDPISHLENFQEDFVNAIETGDTNKNSGEWFELSVSRPYIYHGSIGPSAAVAKWADERLTVWTHSQGVFQLRNALSMVFEIPEEKIVVIHCMGSGCYGHNGADDVALDAALLAKSVNGRSVKVVWSRYDEFHAAPMGAAMSTKARAHLGPDTLITAFETEITSVPHSTRPGTGGTANLRSAVLIENSKIPARSPDVPIARGGGAERNAVPSYDFGPVSVKKRLVHDLPYRASALRSLGAFNNVIATEGLVDDIAYKVKIDPIDFRLQHISDPRSREILTHLDKETKEKRRKLKEGQGWGVGFARYKGISGFCAVYACVSVDEEVAVDEIISVSDVGEAISIDGVKNQIEGGIIQSISWTLKEAVAVDGLSSKVDTWFDYPILKFSEVPKITTILINRPDEKPLGAAEISQGPGGAAVANAVRNALGIRVKKLPITRDELIAATL